MKPFKTEVWACGICKQTFTTKHRVGKTMAEQCCTCIVEGCKNPIKWMGARVECEWHRAKETLDKAQESERHAVKWHAEAREHFRKVDEALNGKRPPKVPG